MTARRVDPGRESILTRLRMLRDAIGLDLDTAAHWNDQVRKPDEELIEIDPDGSLRRWVNAADQVLADDPGHGPIAELPEVPDFSKGSPA